MISEMLVKCMPWCQIVLDLSIILCVPGAPTIQVQNTENRDDEPLDAKYFQPKSSYGGGIIRRDKSSDRAAAKPSAYFKKWRWTEPLTKA